MGAKEKAREEFVEGVIAVGQERLALGKLFSILRDGQDGDILAIVKDSTDCIKTSRGLIRQKELYQAERIVRDSNNSDYKLITHYALLDRAVVHYRPF
jgi:hypothetical protein